MAETFESYVDRSEKLLHRLEKNEEVDLFSKKIRAFYKATELLFPQELNAFLDKNKFNPIVNKVSSSINRSNENMSVINIDYAANMVVIGDKKSQITSAKNIVLDIFKINEQSLGHYLLLSLLTDKELFELFQVFLNLKAKES